MGRNGGKEWRRKEEREEREGTDIYSGLFMFIRKEKL